MIIKIFSPTYAEEPYFIQRSEVMNISSLNHKTLDLHNATSLHNVRKSESLEKVEEQMKGKVIEQPSPFVASNTPINREEIKVSIQGELAHFQFVQDIEELSADEKRHIDRLIQQSVSKPTGGTGSYFVMDRAQSTAQLQIIAEKLIPEKYQEQMNEAIKSFQEDRYNYDVKLYEAFQSHMDDLTAQHPSIGKKTILQDGMQRLQEQESFMNNLYSGLDFSTQSSFVHSFETALMKFKEEQLQQKNSPESVLNQYQEDLRGKWNDFAIMLNDPNVYQLSTAGNSVFDVKL